MRSSLLLAAIAACGGGRVAAPPPEAKRPALPGTLWWLEDTTLVRLAGGVQREIGDGLFPSAHALPDGRLVAIASRGDGTAGSEQLALVAPDGAVERRGPAAAQVRDPAVDSRGRWIVVAANLDGRSDLYRVDLAGPVTRLTDDPAGNFRPAVLGNAIVYVSSRDGDAEVYVRRDGVDLRITAFHRDDWDPTPAPDGGTIAFVSDREGPARIFLIAPDGTNLRRLTDRAGADEEGEPRWSPDGRLLAYIAGGRVYLRDVVTGSERAITPSGATDLEPAFSPDGQWLAVARARDRTSDVLAIPLAGGDPVSIARDAWLPRWL